MQYIIVNCTPTTCLLVAAVAEQLLFQSLPQHTGWDNMGHVGATAGRQQQPQMAQTQGRVPAKVRATCVLGSLHVYVCVADPLA
jgi:hypothetical protein